MLSQIRMPCNEQNKDSNIVDRENAQATAQEETLDDGEFAAAFELVFYTFFEEDGRDKKTTQDKK